MNIAIDTETRLFVSGYMAPKIVCLSKAWRENQRKDVFSELHHHTEVGTMIWQLFHTVLCTHDTLIGHNMAYDMACIYEHYPNVRDLIWKLYDKKLVQCTLCREKLIDIAKGRLGKNLKSYSLTVLTKKYFGVEMDKDTWRLRYQELEDIPLNEWPEGAVEYAISDAEYTLKLYEKQKDPYDIFRQEAARQASYAFALQLTSCRGMLVDQDRLQKINIETQAEKEAQYNIAKEYNLWHVVGKKEQKNTKELKRLIEKSYPGEVPKTKSSDTYPEGQIKTDEDTIEKCKHKGLEAYSKYKKAEKLQSTYIQILLNAKEKPVHAGYDVLKETGRTSSFKPNIQNQPRKGGIRECFIARPGWVFIFCDYDSQEMRTLAETCYRMGLSSTLGEKYRTDPDFDPHTYFAADYFLGLSYQEGMRLKKEKDELLLERRQQSKAANFGYPGGMGAKIFVEYAEGYGVELTLEESEKIKKGFFETWPEMKQYFNIISHITSHGTGDVTQVVSGRVRGNCTFTSAANSFFQGLASDVSKYALYQVVRKCFIDTGALRGCRPVAFIHDEVGIEAPEEYAPEAAKELENTMVDTMEELCTHVPSRASSTIMRRWSKKAYNVFDSNGNWIPWEE